MWENKWRFSRTYPQFHLEDKVTSSGVDCDGSKPMHDGSEPMHSMQAEQDRSPKDGPEGKTHVLA
ncbi:hypothetical protein HanHA300_Chr06g0223951 [Helianthus annuus]|nr:hypothetical protein HanHA300_Chr06g0223951 [Helianthus annuus]KAJ0574592.1 hypothetical protein HanHA89_Chr06g0239901 [Helianthus annuus]KAJ0738924.1 hypothetical protein HanLR1_Chr06g0223811 [Helianthus annuus]